MTVSAPSAAAAASSPSTSTSSPHAPGPGPACLLLKTGRAAKLGRDGGAITYQILCDPERTEVYLAVTANSASGYFSAERIALAALQACLPQVPGEPFPARAFRRALTTRTANQPGFVAAVLRAEGLLGPDPQGGHRHRAVGDWAAWQAGRLALPAVPCDPVAATVQEIGPAPEAGGEPEPVPAAAAVQETVAETAIRREAPPEDSAEDDGPGPARGPRHRRGRTPEARHARPA